MSPTQIFSMENLLSLLVSLFIHHITLIILLHEDIKLSSMLLIFFEIDKVIIMRGHVACFTNLLIFRHYLLLEKIEDRTR